MKKYILLKDTASQRTINLSDLAPGLYLVEWHKQGQVVETQKLMRL